MVFLSYLPNTMPIVHKLEGMGPAIARPGTAGTAAPGRQNDGMAATGRPPADVQAAREAPPLPAAAGVSPIPTGMPFEDYVRYVKCLTET